MVPNLWWGDSDGCEYWMAQVSQEVDFCKYYYDRPSMHVRQIRKSGWDVVRYGVGCKLMIIMR